MKMIFNRSKPSLRGAESPSRHCEEGVSPMWQSIFFILRWIATPPSEARNDGTGDVISLKFTPRGGITLLAMTITYILVFSQTTVIAFEGTQKFETYLNSIKTLSGEFTQVNSRGKIVTGTIQISRPGKMRLVYNPPSPLVIVSDGKWLINYDKEADEVTYLTLEKTPAAFILRPNISFHGDVEVTSVVPKGDATAVTLIRKDDPEEGYITLVFDNNPVALTEWSVVDAQGIETRVILSNMKSNVQLPSGLFHIKSPNLIQQIF